MAVFKSDNPYSEWMKNLPVKLTELPLNFVSLPGSHDSFTFDISSRSGVAPDAEDVIKKLTKIFGFLAKSIIARWAKAQNLNTFDQLQAGIRYLDIRSARNVKAKDEIYSCHGLFGCAIKEQLILINDFLNMHPWEVVLLDFNHFYDFTMNEHNRLVRYFETIFTSKLIPFTGHIPSLKQLWQTNHRVFVFYHNNSVSRPYLWPGYYIPSPWPNTNKLDVIKAFWKNSYNKGHNTQFFHVMQAVLTPQTSDIVKHVFSSLRAQMADKSSPAFVQFTEGCIAGRDKLNTSIIDFAGDYNYVESIMQANLRTASELEIMSAAPSS